MKHRDLRPLSQAQLGIWFAQMLCANKSLYNIGEAIEILGPIDPALFEKALRQVVETTDALHLKFVDTDDGPRQFLAPEPGWPLPLIDFSGESDSAAAAAGWMQEAMDRVVDLAQDRQFDYALLRVAADRYIWYSRYHHLCIDGFGIALVARRVAAAYSSLVGSRFGPESGAERAAEVESRPSWFDLLEEEHAYESSAQFARDRDYWRLRLADRPERATLAGRSASWPDAFVRSTAKITQSEARALEALGEGCQASLSQVLITAIALYVRRLTGAHAFALGMVLNARPAARLQRTVGMVSNVVPLCLEVDPTREFAALAREIKLRVLDAQLHQRYRLEYLRRELELEPTEPEFFGPVVNICSFDYRLRFGDHPVRARNIGNWRVDDLEINVYDRRDGGDIWVEFCGNPRLYSSTELNGHLRRFLKLLQALATAGADAQVNQASLLGAEEEQALRTAFNAVPERYPQTGCLHTIFEKQVIRSPETVALRLGADALTYGELNARANRLAHFLREHGVRPDALIALCMERSFDMLVAILGVLKAGGAYLPIDPSYPANRIRYLLEDSGASVVLTQEAIAARLPAGERLLCVALDDPAAQRALSEYPATNPDPVALDLGPQQLAYVIYTSGSTGEPKGVMIEHRNVTRLFDATRPEFEFGPGDVWTLFHSYAFDFSVWEIWGALLHGGTLVIVPYVVSRSPSEFHALLRSERVTVLNQTPSAFLQLIEEDQARERLAALRVVIFGGEALDLGALAPWVRRYGDERPQLINMYGITETTVHVTYRRLQRAEILAGSGASLIGRPLRDLSLWLLNDARDLAPVGVPGEMYVGGAGVARGYLNRPELTSQRFIANPLVPGERLYRTGDRARLRADGELEYLGRIDQQVKIRGFRIETGEIEAELRKHERVQDAFVTVYRRGEHQELAAYVVAREDDSKTATATHAGRWQQLYDAVYSAGEGKDGDFNIIGWDSSYTGKPIPASEMRLWVEEQVARIRALRPRRVLEIGCGTGLLLTRLAGSCESYLGIDFSGEVLAQLGRYLAHRPDLAHVVLRQARADDLASVADDSVDLVIINSVVQYFPGVDYLLEVLAGAVRVTCAGGRIFVGDVRNLRLFDAYHASVQLHKAPAEMSIDDLRTRVEMARHNEEELLVDPTFFLELARRWKKLGRVEMSPKLAAYDNELSRFRYDVVMQVGEKEELETPRLSLTWDSEGTWRDALRAQVTAGAQSVGLRGIRDARSLEAAETFRLLRDAASGLSRASELKRAAARPKGENLAAVADLARTLDVSLHWQELGLDATYEAIFNARWRRVGPGANAPPGYYRQFVNQPAVRGEEALERLLVDRLRDSLPEYMVPRSIMVLRAWPLTPNGKLDRRALPIPTIRIQRSAGAEAAHRAPRTSAEKLLAGIWADTLGLERVGADENFFDLGGNSLLAVQLCARIRKSTGRNLPMASLFEAPTVAQMARIVQHETGSWACLRAIKPGGSRPPLFLVPGIGGDVIVYHELAPLLGPEQPVYGLQPPGLDGFEKPVTRVADLAARFVREIRTVQRRGPYYLGAACIGGVIAYEMAQQLVRAGEEVALLAMLDAWPPSVHRAGVIPQIMPPFMSVPIMLGKGIGRLPRAFLRARPSEWLHHLRGRLKSAQEIVARRNVFEADTAGLYTDLVRRSTYWAMFKYFPRVYPGRIVLFVAVDRPLPPGPDGRLLWRKLARQGCQMYYVGGKDTGAMLKRPHVQLIARHLVHEIDKAAAKHGAPSRAEEMPVTTLEAQSGEHVG